MRTCEAYGSCIEKAEKATNNRNAGCDHLSSAASFPKY